MSTDTPILSRAEQSRRNGARSRGPKTAAGKQRVSANALKDGRFADKFANHVHTCVLLNEARGDWGDFLKVRMDQFLPETEYQCQLVIAIAREEWEIERCNTLESQSIEAELERQVPILGNRHPDFSEFAATYLAVEKLAKNPGLWRMIAARKRAALAARREHYRLLVATRRDFPVVTPVVGSYEYDIAVSERHHIPEQSPPVDEVKDENKPETAEPSTEPNQQQTNSVTPFEEPAPIFRPLEMLSRIPHPIDPPAQPSFMPYVHPPLPRKNVV